MALKLPTLPLTVDARADESLLSLAYRNARASQYPTATWIGDLIGQDLLAAQRDPAMVPKLASCFRMSRKEVLRRTYYSLGRKRPEPTLLGARLRNFWGHRVPEGLIDTTRVWLCPTCYAETQYLRSIWSLMLYRACHTHGVWLVHQCACKREIDYRRHKLEKCVCGRDVLDQATVAPRPVVDLAAYLYKRVHVAGPATPIGQAPKDFALAPFGEFVAGVALLMGQNLGLGTSHGFEGFLSEFRDLSPARFASGALESLVMLEEWPQKLDEYLDRGLRVVDRRIEIERHARTLIKPFVSWALPKSLEFLTNRSDAAVSRRREGLLRSILKEEFRQGDERLMIPLADAAQKLGVTPDQALRVLSCYVPRDASTTRRGREIVVTDAEELETLIHGLKSSAKPTFKDEFVETVSFKEAGWISHALGVDAWTLLRALAAAEIEFTGCSSAAVSPGTIRINYQALLGWCQSAARIPREWLRFSTASKVAVMRVQAFDQVLSRGYMTFRGHSGHPDQREISVQSLIRFRTDYRLPARIALGYRRGRGFVLARLSEGQLSSIVGSDKGSSIMLAVSDIRHLVQ